MSYPETTQIVALYNSIFFRRQRLFLPTYADIRSRDSFREMSRICCQTFLVIDGRCPDRRGSSIDLSSTFLTDTQSRYVLFSRDEKSYKYSKFVAISGN